MEAPRLNKSRDYGTIHPPFRGAQFEQDGCYFSGSGEFLFREGQTASAGRAAGASVPAKPVSEAKPTADAPETVVETADGPDLAAWARGDVNIPFFTVKKVVGQKYPGVVLKNTKTIMAGLVEVGAISASDAKR